MPSADNILDAAKAIRSELSSIEGKVPHDFEAELTSRIISAEAGEISFPELESFLLTSCLPVRDRLAQLLDLPQSVESASKGFQPLAGQPQVAKAQKYICPVEGCDAPPWYRLRVSDDIPNCPVHTQISLIPSEPH